MAATTGYQKIQVHLLYAVYLGDRCKTIFQPLLQQLNTQLDRRLVRTFLGLILVILRHRHRQQGLVLSELGGHLLTPEEAQAGQVNPSNKLPNGYAHRMPGMPPHRRLAGR